MKLEFYANWKFDNDIQKLITNHKLVVCHYCTMRTGGTRRWIISGNPSDIWFFLEDIIHSIDIVEK